MLWYVIWRRGVAEDLAPQRKSPGGIAGKQTKEVGNVAERKGIPLLYKISIGFVVGVVLGVVVPGVVPTLAPVGKIFIALLKMLIVPLVFSSIVVGTASLGDVKTLGRVGAKIVALYLVTTAFAVALGLLFGNLIQPGAGMQLSLTGIEFKMPEVPKMINVLLDIFPTNIVESLVKGNMLQIIVFALLFGVAAVFAGAVAKPVLDVMNATAETMYKLTGIVMECAPYGVAALMAETVSKYGVGILGPFAKLILVVYVAIAVHALVVYSLVVRAAGKSPWWFFSGVKEAMVTAFVTRSSSATLPVSMRVCEENLRVNPHILSFTLPLGATVNMDGTAIYQGVCTLFVAQAFGIDLPMSVQLGIILTATLASIGTAGVPGAGLIMLTLTLQYAGLPVESIALIAGIDAILDMARTCVNVTGDLACTTLVAKSEKDGFLP